MKSRIETIIIIELEKIEKESFLNLVELSEDMDSSFIDIEIRDEVKTYFILPNVTEAIDTINEQFKENSNERKIISFVLDKIEEIEDFNYIEIRGIA